MKAVYDVAKEYLGLKEYPGAKHNPTIVQFAETVGHGWVQDDETPWCASFVGACLAQAGLQGTGKLNARSYLGWGEEINIADAEAGDIVVFWRGSPDSWTGHVGFYAGHGTNTVQVLGGNQGNSVSIADYPTSRLLGVRRAKQQRTSLMQSTTLGAAGLTATGIFGSAGPSIGSLDSTAQLIVVASVVVALAGLAWIARERIKKWASGVR